jgi:hypothetical protein
MNGVPRHHHWMGNCCLFTFALVLGVVVGVAYAGWVLFA